MQFIRHFGDAPTLVARSLQLVGAGLPRSVRTCNCRRTVGRSTRDLIKCPLTGVAIVEADDHRQSAKG